MTAAATKAALATPPATRSRRRRWFRRTLGVLALVLLELAVAGLVYQAIATERDRRLLPAPGQLVDVGGHRLHLQCAGQGGPTVILETGLGAWSSHWALIQPAVAERTRVCSYDRAGVGWSDAGPEPRDARRIATELHALLEHAGVPGPYVLVGHSNGGLYVRMFASLYPDSTAGLVLLDPTPADLFERLPATRTDFARLEQQARAFHWLAPFGLVRLLVPGALATELAAFPARARDEIVALDSVGRQWQGLAAEVEALPAAMAQVRQTGGLDARPLIVLSSTETATASAEDREIKLQLDADVAALSSEGTHVVVQGATHSGLAATPEHARLTATAIHRVVDAVRGGEPIGRVVGDPD
jgi:pimeloyl-ACP methyl ester carboxylesterase